MNCKDCIHYSLCDYDEICHYSPDNIKSAINCSFFHDRSRFVELPCRVGDVIFCTTMRKIHQGIVSRIELDDEGFTIITTDGYCFDSSICYHTKEEAEQALKECENND